MWSRKVILAVTVIAFWLTAFVTEAGPMLEPTNVLSGVPVLQDQAERQAVQEQVRHDTLARVRWEQARHVEEAALTITHEQRSALIAEEAHRTAMKERIADLAPPIYQQMVLDVAQRFDVDPRLIAAVIRVESVWNPNLLGAHQDTGLMQILPGTGRWIATRMGLAEYDLWDPATNVTMGTWYLKTLYGEYGSWEKALAAYNGGPSHAHRGAEHPYTRLVMGFYDR